MMMYNLESISYKLIESITDLFDNLGIDDYIDCDNRIMFQCPIHGGGSFTNSSIMKKGIGNWKCFSEQCHEEYGSNNGASILQFVQAVLKQNNPNITFFQSVQWAAKLVGEEINTKITDEDIVRTNFIQLCKYINRSKPNHVPVFTPREMIRNFLKIPAEYYIKRGYTENILCKYDVGYCFNMNKSFFDRIITPFYDDDGKYMIGCSGRNKNEQCDKCKFFHDKNVRCPITREEKLKATKWKHSSNFAADSYLYNYWNAKKHILNSNTAILVEGTGDVWRLEEAGIKNSLGLLGARLSQNQQIILEESGAVNLLIATDNDSAGNKAANSIIQNCRKIFNIKRIEFPGKDPGGLTIEQTKQIFIPILERI